MPRPLVGVIGHAHLVNDRYPAQLVGEKNLRAVVDVADALPVMFAGAPDITDIGSLLDTVDGVLLTGGRSNVHPARFNVEPHPSHEPYDENRDAVALRVTEACVERGVPILGLCRGIQEMGVAFGSTLHPEIRDLPGRMNHRAIRLENGEVHPDQKVVFADRHEVRLVPGGVFARLFGRETIRVNSLHGQGILEPGTASSSRAWPRTTRSRPSGSTARPASRSASSGMPSTIRKPTRSTAPCSAPSARRSGNAGERKRASFDTPPAGATQDEEGVVCLKEYPLIPSRREAPYRGTPWFTRRNLTR